MTPAEAYDAARDQLRDALKEADSGIRVARGLTVEGDPPCVVLSPPAFVWEGQCDPDEPTSMTMTLYLVERVDPVRAVERLLRLLPELIVALQGVHDALVTDARPAVFPSGTADFPAYLLTAEMTL